MTKTKAAVVAWSSFGFGGVMFVAAISLSIASNPHRPAADRVQLPDVLWAVSVLSVPLIGPFLASRQPRNPIGWLLCALGVGLPTALAASEYAIYASSIPGVDLPAPEWAGWSSNIAFTAAYTSLALVILLIPSGDLPSPRWRWVARLILGGSGIALAGDLLAPGTLDSPDTVPNPVGIEGAEFLHPVSDIGFGLFALGILLAAASTLVRFKRANGEVRQQLKWFAFGTVALILILLALTLLETVLGSDLDTVATLGFAFGMLALAGGLAVSVLKYRLYDIDIVVNRTIVYLLLSVLLGFVYFGGIAVLQGLIGFGGDSELTVAASTLAVAGLFQPARRRIQGFIDHHFYRRKYDAERTVEDFSSRLRDEIDLEALNSELVAVVSATMQPTHISVWLSRREPA
jgi:hypothetical protein